MQVSRALVIADIDLIELKTESVSLEDIFLQLTGTTRTSGRTEEDEDGGEAAAMSSVVARGAARLCDSRSLSPKPSWSPGQSRSPNRSPNQSRSPNRSPEPEPEPGGAAAVAE